METGGGRGSHTIEALRIEQGLVCRELPFDHGPFGRRQSGPTVCRMCLYRSANPNAGVTTVVIGGQGGRFNLRCSMEMALQAAVNSSPAASRIVFARP